MMVEEAVKMPEGKDRDYLTILIANQMKKSAAAWNRGNVSDDVIFKDIVDLADGKLSIPENTRLLDVKDLIGPKKKKTNKHQGKQKKKHHTRH